MQGAPAYRPPPVRQAWAGGGMRGAESSWWVNDTSWEATVRAYMPDRLAAKWLAGPSIQSDFLQPTKAEAYVARYGTRRPGSPKPSAEGVLSGSHGYQAADELLRSISSQD